MSNPACLRNEPVPLTNKGLQLLIGRRTKLLSGRTENPALPDQPNLDSKVDANPLLVGGDGRQPLPGGERKAGTVA